MAFLDQLRASLLTGPADRFVFLGNFEVERDWAVGEVGLPTVALTGTTAVVNRMDEFALLLAGPRDRVVLKAAPDPGYLHWLTSLGIELPELIPVREQDPLATVTRDALADPAVLAALRVAGAAGARLLPHGMSGIEEELCAATGLASATPGAAVCKAVNSKIYSRRVADEVGLRQPRGWVCESVEEFAGAAAHARPLVEAGGRVGVKEAYGVSGKGIVVLEDPARFDLLLRMLRRRAARSGDQRLALVVEEWVEKRADLNYQFTVGRDGSVAFDFVKEAITENGVHKGHRIPARLTPVAQAEIEAGAQALGKRLAADGYAGVVGVDALLTVDGTLYPVIEINARNNMSTYQVTLQERFLPAGGVALARHYPVRLDAPLGFERLREHLGGLLFTPGGDGLLVNNYATVNAAASGTSGTSGEPFEGRLYGLLIADSQDRLDAIDTEIAGKVAAL